MNYITGTAAAIAIILFYKLFSERRRNSDNSNNSTSQQSNSTTISSEVVSGDSTLVSLPTGEYEVFLSFRGPDTRHHITDILYRFLVHLKIRTFRDDDELRKGEEIGRNLVQAIGQSKIYVPIISERYAHSKWCLKELVEIVQHHKQDQRHMILPIFYMVDPRDVRHQTGPYESAFRQHKKNKFDEATIQSWKDALKEVGALKGWHVKTKEEHAFKQDFPLLGFEALSKDIVSTTGGLPLTLKVVGSLLFLETEDIWKDKLEQLRKFPEEEVMKRLMISYNGLGYEAQQIFLDIACFYIGTKKEIPSYLWSDCNFHPVSCINLLIQRSMLKIGKENKFEMHDQLRDMGREIVRQENIEHPEMRSRIWSLEEGRDVLVNNKGTNQVRAIRAYSKYKFVVDRRCLTNMTELRYFDVEDAELIGDFSHVLPNLKWMHFKDMETTASFSMKNMVIFDAYRCPIQYIPTKEAKKLKFLQLGNCEKMSKFPEFPESLEMLYLRTFYNKEEDMELRNLHNLKVLKLQTCTLGRIKGGTVGTMKGLRELELSWIKCDFHSFRRVIADIGELSSLEILQFNSPALKDVLEGIQLPKSLKVLSTSSCFDNFSELLDLEDFSMTSTERMTELVSLPASKLKSIELYCKARIIMVEGHLNTMLPSSLTRVRVFHLQSDRIPNVKNLRNLTSLILAHCPNVQEIQGLGGLKSLQFLQVSNMEKLANIDGLGNLMSSSNCKLTDVRILSCPLLRALRTFEQHDEDDDDSNDAVRIESLFSLHIQGCPLMDCRSVPKLSKFPRLRKLSIGEIGSNINDESGSQRDHDQLLEGLDNLGEMVLLQVSGLAKLERLPCLSKLTKLTKLTVSNLPCLREIAGLGELKSLEWLKVAELPCLGEIAGLGELKSLKRLEVIGVRCLREIAGLGELKKSLKELVVRGCISLERFPVEDLPYSEMHYIELDLRGCTNFTNVDSDLSPLTTRAAELRRRVMLIIKWPNEPLRDES